MARTLVTNTTVSRTGSDVATLKDSAVADGNNFYNNGNTWIEVNNGNGGSINATFQTPQTVAGLAVAELVVAVGSGERQIIGPFPIDTFNQSDGTVYVDWSDVTSLTFEVFQL